MCLFILGHSNWYCCQCEDMSVGFFRGHSDKSCSQCGSTESCPLTCELKDYLDSILSDLWKSVCMSCHVIPAAVLQDQLVEKFRRHCSDRFPVVSTSHSRSLCSPDFQMPHKLQPSASLQSTNRATNMATVVSWPTDPTSHALARKYQVIQPS